jgi:glutamine amidotransferase
MCRLFAVSAEHPVKVDRAFRALKRQAEEHKDGWGIARFGAHTPELQWSIRSAAECPRFDSLVESLEARTLLAHIRLASVGGVREENSHPFYARGMAFMHNGTLRHFDAVRDRFDALLAPKWRAWLKGETDSERCFALFLTYLDAIETPTLDDLARTLARVMHTAAALCDDVTDEKRSAMNFLVTDGRCIVASRRGRTLFVTEEGQARYVASEPLWGESTWRAVPEDGLVLIDEHLSLRVSAVSDWA